MLDEHEWAQIDERWKDSWGAKGEWPIEERFKPVRELYLQLTGFDEPNHLAIMHHRISLYGDPCENCGKLLRTPEATFCAACGWQPES